MLSSSLIDSFALSLDLSNCLPACLVTPFTFSVCYMLYLVPASPPVYLIPLHICVPLSAGHHVCPACLLAGLSVFLVTAASSHALRHGRTACIHVFRSLLVISLPPCLFSFLSACRSTYTFACLLTSTYLPAYTSPPFRLCAKLSACLYNNQSAFQLAPLSTYTITSAPITLFV